MNNLGDMYQNGSGVEKDVEKAKELYEMAIKDIPKVQESHVKKSISNVKPQNIQEDLKETSLKQGNTFVTKIQEPQDKKPENSSKIDIKKRKLIKTRIKT